jgi:hypothetical protein
MSVEKEEIDGKDFLLTRRPDGRWSVCWQWLSKPRSHLFKGVRMYCKKLKTQEMVGLFNKEVMKWINAGILVPYNADEMGRPLCTLTWNPILQPQKNTKVRLVLDYTILNPFVRDEKFQSQSEICTEMIFKWRKCTTAFLVDIDKAYTHIHVDDSLLNCQRVWVGDEPYAMTRMGFGLNIATRVLFLLLKHLLKGIEHVLPYRDDILVTGDNAHEQVISLRAKLLANGLPTKDPKNLYDFSSGPTQALGLMLQERDGSIIWRRRELQDKYCFSTCRQVASFFRTNLSSTLSGFRIPTSSIVAIVINSGITSPQQRMGQRGTANSPEKLYRVTDVG